MAPALKAGLVAALCLAACGKSDGSSFDAAVDGSIHDQRYAPDQLTATSISLVKGFPDNPNSYDTTFMTLVFGQKQIDACGSPASGQGMIRTLPAQSVLQVQVASMGAAIVPGNFRFASSTMRDGEFGARIDRLVDCTTFDPNTADLATGGSVTITSVTALEIAGQFELTFPSGSVRGSFRSPFCTRHWVTPNWSR
jgi:hypothetical protein